MKGSREERASIKYLLYTLGSTEHSSRTYAQWSHDDKAHMGRAGGAPGSWLLGRVNPVVSAASDSHSSIHHEYHRLYFQRQGNVHPSVWYLSLHLTGAASSRRAGRLGYTIVKLLHTDRGQTIPPVYAALLG